jgi:hypothetical protein
MTSTFRKKPLEVQAMQWDGSNTAELVAWSGGEDQVVEHVGRNLLVHARDAARVARPYDWVVRDVDGEYYPYRPDAFAKQFDPVEQVGGQQ